ncbi:hypothetical protein [uncultured Alistipes sp.]|nr:hypothetical protein [uncultured Alistipes sp.]
MPATRSSPARSDSLSPGVWSTTTAEVQASMAPMLLDAWWKGPVTKVPIR